MNVFELFATLGLDTTEYDEGLSSAENRGSSFGQGVRSAARAAGAALAGATTAVVSFGTSSVRAGMTFDSSMSQVAATMGTTVDQIGELRDFAQEMGASTAFSATEAADALNYMALAGYDAETSMQMLPNVLNLAAAGDISLARASDMVTDAQSALGLSLDETTTMVDQMARASSMTNTSVEQLGDAFLTIGATASNLSGGTNELATMLGVLADNGIKGAEGGTHLRNMILSLTNPTNTAGDALEELGVQVYDSEGNMRSMIDVIYELQQVTESMSQEERDSYIGAIFNRADMASVNALLSTTITRYDDISEALDNASGAAENMADTQLDNLAGDITLFQSALEGAKIAISDSLSPTLRNFVQMGSEGLSSITQAFQEDGLEGAMGALGNWLSEALRQIVSMTPQIISAAIQLLGALGQGLIQNAPALAESAIVVMQMLIDSFTDNVSGGGLTQLLSVAAEIVGMLGNFLIQNAPTLITAAVDLIVTLCEFLTSPDNLTALIQGGLTLLGAVAMGLLEAAPELLGLIPEIIGNLCIVLSDNAPLLLDTTLQILGALGMAILQSLAALMGTSLDEVGSGILAIQQDVTDKFNSIRDFISGILTSIGDFFSEGIQGWQNFFSDGFNNIYDTISGVLDNVLGIFTSIFDNVKDVVSGAIDFIRGLFDFEWSLPEIQLPHFTVSGGEAPWGFAGQGSMPRVAVDWYAKAYDQPFILNDPTIFGYGRNGNLLGGGEGAGGELVVGWDALKKELGSSQGVYEIHVHNYIGGEEIDELVVNSNQDNDKISGGRG